RVMNEINRVTAVTPGALVATALLVHGKRGLPHAELLALCEQLTRTLLGFGARFTPSALEPGAKSLRPAAIREECELFVRAGHVEAHLPGAPTDGKSLARLARAGADAIYIVPDSARLSLDLAKNVLVHFFVDRGLVATVLAATDG